MSIIKKIAGADLVLFSKVNGMDLWSGTIPIPFLTGWSNRKAFSLSRPSGAIPDYQIDLNVNRSSGVDSGLNVFVGTNCLANFNDIRITESDGQTLVPYNLDGYSGTVGKIVFKPSVINTDQTNFYLYYNNPAATNGSDPDNTYLYYNSFEQDTSGQKPTARMNNITGEIYVYDKNELGDIFVKDGNKAVANNGDFSASFASAITNFRAKYWFRRMAYNPVQQRTAFYFRQGAPGYGIGIGVWNDNQFNIYEVINYAWSARAGISHDWSPGGDYRYFEIEVKVLGSRVDGYVDGGSHISYDSINLSSNSYPFSFTAWAGGRWQWDQFRIMKYVANEPEWGAWGVEESP